MATKPLGMQKWDATDGCLAIEGLHEVKPTDVGGHVRRCHVLLQGDREKSMEQWINHG